MTTPGLIVAPLTPFTADLEVDVPALKRQIDYVVRDCGATMIVAAGVETQEYTYLSLEQRKALIRSTIELVDRRIPVMVGVTHPSFKTSVELANFALDGPAVSCKVTARPGGAARRKRDASLVRLGRGGRETTASLWSRGWFCLLCSEFEAVTRARWSSWIVDARARHGLCVFEVVRMGVVLSSRASGSIRTRIGLAALVSAASLILPIRSLLLQ